MAWRVAQSKTGTRYNANGSYDTLEGVVGSVVSMGVGSVSSTEDAPL